MRTACLSIILLLKVALYAGEGGAGVRPHRNPEDYQAQSKQNGGTIAATLLTPDQVKGMFATDLSRRYLVVEVAVYPPADNTVDVAVSDFELRVQGTKTPLRATDSRAIAAALTRRPQSRQPGPNDIALYPTASVGYGSGDIYDPVTGRQRGRGWSTGVGVGVGVGGPSGPGPSGPSDADRKTMQTELEEKGLPAGKASQAVAGYLYFAMPSGKRPNGQAKLDYRGPKGDLQLDLPLH